MAVIFFSFGSSYVNPKGISFPLSSFDLEGDQTCFFVCEFIAFIFPLPLIGRQIPKQIKMNDQIASCTQFPTTHRNLLFFKRCKLAFRRAPSFFCNEIVDFSSFIGQPEKLNVIPITNDPARWPNKGKECQICRVRCLPKKEKQLACSYHVLLGQVYS